MAEKAIKRERTCIGCGTKAGKTELFRLVRTSCNEQSSVHFDATGRESGRGAYVCSTACLEGALKAGKLQRALRVALNSEDARKAVSDLQAACSAASRG